MPAAIGPYFPNFGLFECKWLTDIIKYFIIVIKIAEITIINMFMYVVITELKDFLISLILEIRHQRYVILLLRRGHHPTV